MWWNHGFHIAPETVLHLSKSQTPFYEAVTLLGRHTARILGLCDKGGSGTDGIMIAVPFIEHHFLFSFTLC